MTNEQRAGSFLRFLWNNTSGHAEPTTAEIQSLTALLDAVEREAVEAIRERDRLQDAHREVVDSLKRACDERDEATDRRPSVFDLDNMRRERDEARRLAEQYRDVDCDEAGEWLALPWESTP